MSALAPIAKSVAAARRRLFLHALVNRLAGCWAAALALGIGWFLAEPWLVEAPPAWLKWAVVGGLAGVSTVVAVWWAVRVTPSKALAALEIDRRFDLKERVTTALGLAEPELATPAGQAVAADAAERAAGLKVGSRFPVALRWHSAFVPVLAAALAGVTLFYHPTVGQTADDPQDPAKKTADAAKLAEQKKNPTPFTNKNKPPELAARGDKSKELKELEESLNEMMKKYDKDSDKEAAEKAREKATELTEAAERVKKFNEDKYQKLARLEQQLEQLDRLAKDEEFQKGPAKNLNDALSKGDLKKAIDELDQLKKKAQDKKLTEEEKKQLAQQLDKMKEEMKKLAKNQERQQQLKELIQKAKQDGRDAESLERELKALQQEQKDGQEAAKKLADKFQKAQEAMKKGDFDEAAKELEQAGQALKDIEGDLKDLEDAEDYLQRLKEEAKKACKNCGKCDGDEFKEKDDAEWSPEGRPGAGRRKEEADNTNSTEKRHRGLFDPKGKKSYGGATRGPAFKKATTAELGTAISEAAQEAPRATDDPRFPRDAKETVKEYFQKLGDQSPGGNK
ncbi:MAG: hypothetical protein U0871_29035 [Gemmataceae bacterium]